MKKFLLSLSSIGILATSTTTVACTNWKYESNEVRTGIIEGYYDISFPNQVPMKFKKVFLWNNITDISFNSEFAGIDGWYETRWNDDWGQPIIHYQFDYYVRIASNNYNPFYIDSKNFERLMRS